MTLDDLVQSSATPAASQLSGSDYIDRLADSGHVARIVNPPVVSQPTQPQPAPPPPQLPMNPWSAYLFGQPQQGTPDFGQRLAGMPQAQQLWLSMPQEQRDRINARLLQTQPQMPPDILEQQRTGHFTFQAPPKSVIGQMSPLGAITENVLTFGMLQAQDPAAYNEAYQKPITGSSYADAFIKQGVETGVGLAPLLLTGGLSEEATLTGKMLQAARVNTALVTPSAIANYASGNESLGEAATNIGEAAITGGAFGAVGAVPSRLARMLGMAAVGGGSYVGNQVLQGQPIQPTEATAATLVGGLFGIPGGRRAAGDQTSQIQQTIRDAAVRNGVDPGLMLGLAESESGFNPNAKSKTGPQGIFQFTQATADAYGVDRNDVASSANGAAQYMKDLLAKTNGNVEEAVKLYKGYSVGGVSDAGMEHSMSLIDKWQTNEASQVAAQQPAAQALATQVVTSPEDTKAAELSQQLDQSIAAIRNAPGVATNLDTQALGPATDVTDPLINQLIARTPRAEMDLGEHQPYQSGQYVTDEPLVEHEKQNGPNKGDVMQGVVARDLTLDQARAIDPYAFSKDDGYFIHEEHVQRPEDFASLEEPQTQELYQPVASNVSSDVDLNTPQPLQGESTHAMEPERIGLGEDQRIPQGEDLRTHTEEIRQEDRGPASSSGSNVEGRSIEQPPSTRQEEGLIRPPEERNIQEDVNAGIDQATAQRLAASGSLHAQVIPFVGPLMEHDIIPAAQNLSEGATDMFQRVRGTFAPGSAGESGEATRQAMLAPMGEERRQLTIDVGNTANDRRLFNAQKAAENIKFQLRYGEGKAQPTPEMTQAAAKLKDLYATSLDRTRQAGTRTGHLLLQNELENYQAGLYDYNPKLAEKVLGHPIAAQQTLATLKAKGSRMLRGSAFMTKQRTMSLRDHLEMGEVPLHDNPFDQYFEYEKHAAKLRIAHNAIGDLTDQGYARIVDSADPDAVKQAQRDGLVHPFDPTFAVRTQSEAGNFKEHHVYITPESADLFANHLSRGPQNILARAVVPFNMLHNMTTLLGIAHAAITGQNWIGTRGANAFVQAMHGKLAEATKAFGGGFYGKKIRDEYLNPGSASDPGVQEDVKWLTKIGGGFERNPVDYKEMSRSFVRALTNNNYIGALPRGAGAFMEAISSPLMHELVPMAKLDAWRTEYRTALSNLPANATELQRTKAVADAWSNIDDRMGEVFRDRSFMNKNVMFWADMLFPRVNWTLGSYKAIGKTVADVGRGARAIFTGNAPKPTANLMFFPAYAAFAVAPVNTALQYAMTGKAPWETDTPLEDLFLGARTGGTLKDGSPSRLSAINYIRDVFSLSRSPGSTLTAKMNPVFSAYSYWQNNSDFQHNQVYDPNADVVTQAGQVSKMLFKEMFYPFMASNIQRLVREGSGTGAVIASAFGMSPVSVAASESKAGRILDEYYQRENQGKPGLSPDQRAMKDAQSTLAKAYQTSPQLGDALYQKLNIDAETAERIYKRSQLAPLLAETHGADLETAVAAYRAATDAQKAITSHVMNKQGVTEDVRMADIVREKAASARDKAEGDLILKEFGWQRPAQTEREIKSAANKEIIEKVLTPSENANPALHKVAEALLRPRRSGPSVPRAPKQPR